MKRVKFNARTLQMLVPGPLAAAIAGLDPLQRDIIVGLLTADDAHDEMLASRHDVTVDEVRRQRHRARLQLAERLRPTA